MKKLLTILFLIPVFLTGCSTLYDSNEQELLTVTNPGNVTIVNSDGNELLINGGGTVITETKTHYKIESGLSYHIQSYVDLSINNVFDIQFITGDTAIHFTVDIFTESETLWAFYEDSVINNTGTSVNLINLNRSSLNVDDPAFYVITNNDLADANVDTDVSGATLISDGITGSFRDSGLVSHEDEMLLKPNTTYNLRFEATVAGYIDYHLQWYE